MRMASAQACPSCGTAMRPIVWGYGTIADVADAGDVVIGGCVVDVDEVGRVAAFQCPACGTRADDGGFALEQPEPVVAVVEHPFSVGASPAPVQQEVSMSDASQQQFSGDDFGAAVGEGSWPGQATPYSSRDDEIPAASAAAPDHVEPYSSRSGETPPPSAPMPDHVEPYASRSDDIPGAPGASVDRVEPYASREQDDPPRVEGSWQERIAPFDGGASGDADVPLDAAADDPQAGVEAPGEYTDASADDPQADAEQTEVVHGSVDAIAEHNRGADDDRFSDAEEEGWPPGRAD
ncbi:hypothetical protein GCM10010968_00250 [Agrococcus terreus]|uniref:Uncharacterized protein n=2 Tax=Agrococcus terreus TaxID=574649 RepID=A0ABQ2KCF0_9MICO|nr:hypothetical protein GCM10010968_00250 [Agrococcus terreus]